MKMITAIMIVTGLMIVGCVHQDEISTSGKISSVVIPSTLDEKLNTTPQIGVSDPTTLLQVELFLTGHSSDWKTTWHTSIAPDEYILINNANGDSFSFGYSSNILIKYTQDHYRYKQVSQNEIEKFKRLLETIKTSSNQSSEPTLKTPGDSVDV